MAERTEELIVDRLCSGDRPSVYVAGMVIAHALKTSKTVTLAVDVLGRVVVVPPSQVELKSRILVGDDVLDELGEDDAIGLMLREERTEDEILAYLGRRSGRDNVK